MFELPFIALYLGFISLVLYLLRRRLGVIGRIIVGILLILAPFTDVFITKCIMMGVKFNHSPLQKISRTVENPESILWLDEVWPGFDEYGRHWMVESYLDGVHLKSLALNGDDGKIYLYKASIQDFAGSEVVRPEFEHLSKKILLLENEKNEIWKKRVAEAKKAKIDKWPWPKTREKHNHATRELKLKIQENKSLLKDLNYKNIRKQEIDKIFAKPEIYTSRSDLPPAKYLVHLQPLPLYNWQKKFVWCDEIMINDIAQEETMAFSRRCLGYNPFTTVNYPGKDHSFYGGARLGDPWVYEFDNKMLFKYTKENGEYHSSLLTNRRW